MNQDEGHSHTYSARTLSQAITPTAVSHSLNSLKDTHSNRQLASRPGTAAMPHGPENTVGRGSDLYMASEHSYPSPDRQPVQQQSSFCYQGQKTDGHTSLETLWLKL